MNIDLLPFSAFSLESPAPATRAFGDLHTLTLKGALMQDSPYEAAMNGSIEIEASVVSIDSLWHAKVVQADGNGWTITY